MPGTIKLIQADITTLNVDAIVNAANSSLLGGGGVDGAIHRAGGPEILAQCQQIRAKQGPCPTGQAVITTGGRLSAPYVIHTVGPIWQQHAPLEADHLLANCYTNSLKLALAHQLTHVAFPNISTGIYGFPKPRAAQVAVDAVQQFLLNQPEMTVSFVCHDVENFKLYQQLLA